MSRLVVKWWVMSYTHLKANMYESFSAPPPLNPIELLLAISDAYEEANPSLPPEQSIPIIVVMGKYLKKTLKETEDMITSVPEIIFHYTDELQKYVEDPKAYSKNLDYAASTPLNIAAMMCRFRFVKIARDICQLPLPLNVRRVEKLIEKEEEEDVFRFMVDIFFPDVYKVLSLMGVPLNEQDEKLISWAPYLEKVSQKEQLSLLGDESLDARGGNRSARKFMLSYLQKNKLIRDQPEKEPIDYRKRFSIGATTTEKKEVLSTFSLPETREVSVERAAERSSGQEE